MNHLTGKASIARTIGASLLLTAVTMPAAIAAPPNGKAIFDRNCSVCHSIMPPPKSAPPIVPIAARYRQRFTSKEQAVASMAAFLKSPSKSKVVVDPQAVSRFGLMPPVALPDAELRAVAAWVWEQGASGGGWGPGSGAGRGRGFRQ